MTTLCLRRSGPSTGIKPSVIVAASRPVTITTSDRCDTRWVISVTSVAVVGLDQHRFDQGHRVDEGGQDLRRRRPQHAGADLPVGDQQVDPVAGPRRQRSQQQGGVHRVVELGLVADPTGRGAPGVDHDQHVPVAFGPPGLDHHGGRPGRAAPVDGAYVVARHVLAQAVELGALPALQDGRAAVELAQPGQPAGQVLAGAERWQRADGPGRRSARLCRPATPSGPKARRITGPAGRSPRRVGSRVSGSIRRCRAGMLDRLDAVAGAGRRGPGVAYGARVTFCGRCW